MITPRGTPKVGLYEWEEVKQKVHMNKFVLGDKLTS